MDASDIEHWATTVGIALGVIGASWKWIFEEWFRMSRETPSLESGPPTITRLSSDGAREATLIEYNWKNTGSYALYADCQNVSVCIAPASKFSQSDVIGVGDIVTNATMTFYPCRNETGLEFEVGTNVPIQLIVMLDPNESYFVAHNVPLDLRWHRARGRLATKPPPGVDPSKRNQYSINRIDMIGKARPHGAAKHDAAG